MPQKKPSMNIVKKCFLKILVEVVTTVVTLIFDSLLLRKMQM